MGNNNEIKEIENKHEEEIQRITNMKEDNDRKRAIEELAVKNNYYLKKEELQNLAEEARMRHEENIKKINNQHEENIKGIENNYILKKDEQDKHHIEEMEKRRNESKKIEYDYLNEKQRIETQQQESRQNHEEKMSTMDKQHEIRMNQMKENFEQIQNQGKKEIEIIKNNHEKEILNSNNIHIKEMEEGKNKHEENMKKEDHAFELEKLRLQKEINDSNKIIEMQMNMQMYQMMNNQNMAYTPMNMYNQTGMFQKPQGEATPGPLPNENNQQNNNLNNSMNQNMCNNSMQMPPMFCHPMMKMVNWPMYNNMNMMGNMGMPMSYSTNNFGNSK